MDPTTQRPAPTQAACGTCSALGTAHEMTVAALLATSRDYFALRSDPGDTTRPEAAVARRR